MADDLPPEPRKSVVFSPETAAAAGASANPEPSESPPNAADPKPSEASTSAEPPEPSTTSVAAAADAPPPPPPPPGPEGQAEGKEGQGQTQTPEGHAHTHEGHSHHHELHGVLSSGTDLHPHSHHTHIHLPPESETEPSKEKEKEKEKSEAPPSVRPSKAQSVRKSSLNRTASVLDPTRTKSTTKFSQMARTPSMLMSLRRRGPQKKMIDILKPEREPYPVDLPPIGDIRKENFMGQVKKIKSMPALDLQQVEGKKRFNARDSVEVPFVNGDDDPNPFQYPGDIEEFIAQVEREHLEERKKAAKQDPLMKVTSSSKQNQLVLERIKPFMQPSFKPSLAQDYKQVVWRAQNGLHINKLQKVSRKLHTEYIMQRKSIYYLRRAIRAKKIALEMIAKTREFEEACLKDYEWLTDFTKEAFSQFLKENDEKTMECNRKVEEALKEKLEKTIQARQLSTQVNQMIADVVATNENLRECKSYMTFLDTVAKEMMRKDEEEQIREHFRELQVKEEIAELIKQGYSLREAMSIVQEKADEAYDLYRLEDSQENLEHVGSQEFITNLRTEVRRQLGMPEEYITEPEPEEKKSFLALRQRRQSQEDDDSPLNSQNASAEVLPGGNKMSLNMNRYSATQMLQVQGGQRLSLDEGQPDQTPVIEDHGEEILSPRTLVSPLVRKSPSRLCPVILQPQENAAFERNLQAALTAALPKRRSTKVKPGRRSSATPAQEPEVEKETKEPPKDEEDEDGYNEFELLQSLNLVPGDEESDRRELANLTFAQPHQLLQVYEEMEERNQTLNQHYNIYVDMMERMNKTVAATRKQMNERATQLRGEINLVQSQIEENEARTKHLTTLIQKFTGGNYDVRQQQKLYQILEKHVGKVYKAAVGASEHHLNPLMMLTSIEQNFEDLMQEIHAMPTEVVIQISRELDKDRREMERIEKMNQRKAIQEERKSRQLDRANAPVHRRRGRPLLPRSKPPKHLVKVTQQELDAQSEAKVLVEGQEIQAQVQETPSAADSSKI